MAFLFQVNFELKSKPTNTHKLIIKKNTHTHSVKAIAKIDSKNKNKTILD